MIIVTLKGDEHMKNLSKAFIIVFTLVLITLTACSSDKGTAPVKSVHTSDRLVSASDGAADHVKVKFDIQNYGTFTVETFPEYAPETVAHFLKLVEMGYYDGTSFDTITPGFAMVSSGLTALSSGECKETVTGEFAKNGYSNELPITRGTLVMSYLPGEYNSATSRFMIILEDNLDLEGSYAGFGKITEGAEVFDKASSARINSQYVPVSPIVMKKVYIDK